MTKMLQVRDVPDQVHAELRARASAAGMSLSDFARQELTRLTRRPSLAALLDEVAQRADAQVGLAEARAAVLAERPGE